MWKTSLQSQKSGRLSITAKGLCRRAPTVAQPSLLADCFPGPVCQELYVLSRFLKRKVSMWKLIWSLVLVNRISWVCCVWVFCAPGTTLGSCSGQGWPPLQTFCHCVCSMLSRGCWAYKAVFLRCPRCFCDTVTPSCGHHWVPRSLTVLGVSKETILYPGILA